MHALFSQIQSKFGYILLKLAKPSYFVRKFAVAKTDTKENDIWYVYRGHGKMKQAERNNRRRCTETHAATFNLCSTDERTVPTLTTRASNSLSRFLAASSAFSLSDGGPAKGNLDTGKTNKIEDRDEVSD
jgi:hypothetical protein